jgi:hypothetical protein
MGFLLTNITPHGFEENKLLYLSNASFLLILLPL